MKTTPAIAAAIAAGATSVTGRDKQGRRMDATPRATKIVAVWRDDPEAAAAFRARVAKTEPRDGWSVVFAPDVEVAP